MTSTPSPFERRTLLRGATAAGLGALLGGSSAAATLARAAATPSAAALPNASALYGLAPKALGGGCTLTPESTSGPFYFDTGLIRQDITEGKPGLPTFVFLQLVNVNNGCQPIPNAVLDLWHCDALGAYSGYVSEGTEGQTFLRGIQLTDANGIVMFQTIFPGLYQGRTTHFHLKARPTLSSTQEITAQLYFDDLYAQVINPSFSPYNANTVTPTYNNQDAIYVNGGGLETTMITFAQAGPPVFLITGIQIKVPM